MDCKIHKELQRDAQVPYMACLTCVPVSKAEDLRKFYRIIAGDERNTVVLKPTP